jgi:hypothetical protein
MESILEGKGLKKNYGDCIKMTENPTVDNFD